MLPAGRATSVLGPLEVELAAGDVVAPAGARARALLAALLMHPGAVVPVHRLAEAVWGEAQVAARRALTAGPAQPVPR